MLRALSVPPDNTRGPLYMDQALAAVHQGNGERLPVTLAVCRHAGQVTLCCRFPAELQDLVEGQLYAHYPDAKIAPLPDTALDAPKGSTIWTAELSLSQDLFPIKRHPQFDDGLNRQTADPLSALLTAVAGNALFAPTVEVIIRPAGRKRMSRARRCLRHLARPFFRTHHRIAHLYVESSFSRLWPLRFLGWLLGRIARQSGHPEHRPLDTSASRQHDREEDLQAAADKAGRLLFETHIHLRLAVPAASGAADAKRKLRELAGTFGQFNARLAAFHLGAVRRGIPGRFRSPAFLLSSEELATLWHPSTATVRAPTMTVVESREAEPPAQLPTPATHPDLAVLGVATFRAQQQACGILPDDRRRHVYIAGKTGMGKSTLLHRLVSSDIAAGRGIGLIDPHGDLCDAVLASVPAHRTNDVVLFDAGDAEFPLAFNILHCPDPSQRPLVASGVIAAFKKVWADFWGPRMEHILRNALLTLLDVPGTTLLSLQRLLTDKTYRETIVGQVGDAGRRAFWHSEFGTWHPKLQAEAVSPILNKVGAFTSSPILRNIIGQARSTLDLRAVMDQERVLLCNLSKGRIGEDASALLGAFLVTGLQLAAMSRAAVAEERRKDHYLYVDEFQNYATESFATILSEARKYRLNITIANQFLAQVDEQTRAAVFGNVGSMIVFQLGLDDAEPLAAQLGAALTPGDLLTLPRYQAYVRLLINGQPSRPFSLRTLPPPVVPDQRRPHIIRRTSRHRYGRPAAKVGQDIELALVAV